MRISSWNVNSVRARVGNILNYLKNSKPDILMIQEIKTEEKNFPFEDLKNAGYESKVFGQKSYNGVALLSKINITNVNTKFVKDIKSILGEPYIKSKSKADISIAISGIAGPGGGTKEKPVGTVFIGLSSINGTNVVKYSLSGNRKSIKL